MKELLKRIPMTVWKILRFAFLLPYPVMFALTLFEGNDLFDSLTIVYLMSFFIKGAWVMFIPLCDIITILSLIACKGSKGNKVITVFAIAFWAIHIAAMAWFILQFRI